MSFLARFFRDDMLRVERVIEVAATKPTIPYDRSEYAKALWEQKKRKAA